MSQGLRVVEVSDVAALESLRPAWRRLVDQLDDDSPYLTPEFMLPWIALTRDRYRCRVLTAWRGDTLLGLAPMFQRSRRLGAVSFVIRSFPVFGMTPPFDIMIADDERAVMEGFVRHWLDSGPWDLIELADVRTESRTAALLAGAVEGTGLRLSVERSVTTYVVPVVTSWKQFLGSRSRKLRQNLRRGLRSCEELGEPRFLRYPEDGTPLAAAIDMALAVLDRSWKAPGDDRGRWGEFFRTLMAELAGAGLLYLRLLLVGGRPVASLLALDYRNNLHGFHCAFDLAYQRVTPGTLLLGDALRDAHERRYGRLDLGGGADHLHWWTASTRSFDRVSLINASLASRLKARLYRWEHVRRLGGSRRAEESKRRARKAAFGRSAGPDGGG